MPTGTRERKLTQPTPTDTRSACVGAARTSATFRLGDGRATSAPALTPSRPINRLAKRNIGQRQGSNSNAPMVAQPVLTVTFDGIHCTVTYMPGEIGPGAQDRLVALPLDQNYRSGAIAAAEVVQEPEIQTWMGVWFVVRWDVQRVRQIANCMRYACRSRQ